MGRRISARRAVESILGNNYPSFEVILVDQYDAPLAAGAFPNDPRLQYVSSSTVGISAARNVGVQLARAGLIVHTDDDCEAPPDWLESIERVFTGNPGVDVMFGEVRAGKTGPGGFIPSYRVAAEVVVTGVHGKHRIEGIGACMAYRRELWQQLGGFDEALGAGSPLRSAEEVDFTVRALAEGHSVMESPRVHVIHHGYRPWHAQDELLGGHLFGIGVTAAKHLRRSSPAYLYVLARLAWRWAFGRPLVDFGRRPARLPRMRAFVQGLRAGARQPVDDYGRLTGSTPNQNGASARQAPKPARITTPHEPFPNFFLIGAAKSGTSSLHQYLRAHPEVFMCEPKEPNFMAVDGRDRSDASLARLAAVWTPAEYVDLFRGVTTEKAIGEGSSWYLHCPRAAERIRDYAPESRLIAILRDPAERAHSAYRMHRRLGNEPCETFQEALQRMQQDPGDSGYRLEYLEPGFYRRHLTAYRQELEAGRLQIHCTEDLDQDPQATLSKMFGFLGVESAFQPPDLRRRYNTSPGAGTLSPEMRERLVELYREDILELQELLERDLSAWLRVEAPTGSGGYNK